MRMKMVLLGNIKCLGQLLKLDDFVIRVVDGPANEAVTEGPHSSAFEDRIGKTHFLGGPVPPGSVWQAKDVILEVLNDRARDAVAPYQDPEAGCHSSMKFILAAGGFLGYAYRRCLLSRGKGVYR